MQTLVHIIAGARPNFMKVAPLWHELTRHAWCRPMLIHTGQHYDREMSEVFLQDLGLPTPDYSLGVGSGSHAEQTAAIMVAYERICLEQRPDWVIVVGDVNSTIACTLAATKLGIKVAHLEAGLRSFDRSMPEEINRLVVDSLADLLWTPSADGDENLVREGVAPEKIVRVGNIMIDAYEMMRARIATAATAEKLGLAPNGYAVVTLHRPSNVDEAGRLQVLVDALISVATLMPVVFPLHPRTRSRLETAGLLGRLEGAAHIRLLPPQGYVDFSNLLSNARLAITDSGGVQEETTYLGIPCLTLRPSTERPVTVTEGSNRLIRVESLVAEVAAVLNGPERVGRRPEMWDARTAARVAESLRQRAGV